MPQPDQSSNPRPIIFGEVLFDCFPDGQEILGGAPFNVAWHLQGLGYSPLLISGVGDDPRGRRILEAMDSWAMDTSGIQSIPNRPTGTVQITESDGTHAFLIPPDQAYDEIRLQEAAAVAIDYRQGFLYHGTLALRGKTSRETLIVLRDSMEMSVFLDINLRTPWWDPTVLGTFTERAFWLKLNDEELQELTSMDADGGGNDTSMMTGQGLSALFVTRGDRGAMVIPESGETIEYKGDSVQVVDTVGAGDAFSAVCVVGLMSGWPLDLILERAVTFAGAVCGIRGATTQSRDLYRDVKELWRFSHEPGT